MFKRLDNGGIELSYEDYNVESLGGADYEAIYNLSKEESDKLFNLLEKEYKGNGGKNNLDLKQLILNKFGENLNKASFAKYCKENNIKYDLHTFVH